jgi:predicted nucleic-acid-binding Zn-ribbon protein
MKIKNNCVVYKTIDTKTGNIYIGVDTNNNPNYYGSGGNIKRIIKDEGRKNDLQKEILFVFNNPEDAFAKEAEIVNEEFLKQTNVLNKCLGGREQGIWAIGYINVKDDDSPTGYIRITSDEYNKNPGKYKTQSSNMVTVKDKNSKTGYSVITTEEYYKNSEKYEYSTKGFVKVFDIELNKKVLITCEEYRENYNKYIHSENGKTIAKDKNGNTVKIPVDDFYNTDNNYEGVFKGKTPAIEFATGKIIHVSNDDIRFKTGEITGHRSGWHNAKVIATGKVEPVRIDDPRWETGEIVSVNKDKITCIDSDGNYLSIFKDDPRWLNGALKGVNNKKTSAKNPKTGEKFLVSIDDPRWETGEIVGINAGKKYFHNIKANARKQLEPWEIEKYISEGWIEGFGRGVVNPPKPIKKSK